MSAQKIRAALGLLQDDPDNEASYNDLVEAVTSPDAGMSPGELRALLESARHAHEMRREWDAVARLLELEIGLQAGTPVEFAMQFELARVFEDELFDDERAMSAYRRLQQLRPDDPTASEAIELGTSKRRKWKELVQRFLEEARQATDDTFKSSLLMSAGEVGYRYGDHSKKGLAEVAAQLEEGYALDSKNQRVASLLERLYRGQENWAKVAEVLEKRASEALAKDERAASLIRLARVYARKLEAGDKAAAAYERMLDLWPGNSEAMRFLASHFSKSEQYDRLIALYEDQLRGGGAKQGEEAGIIFQIAMVNWRMRQRPELAEPHFDRLRRLEPAHSGMLSFFREFCGESGDRVRLLTILTDAQRSLADGPAKTALATEIAKLAEAGRKRAESHRPVQDDSAQRSQQPRSARRR